MEAATRREQIREILRSSTQPVSASRLAGRLRVSRQVIVGDIALLRASGMDIVATSKGYLLPRSEPGRFVGKVACQHSAGDTVRELYAMVDAGARVLDVIVEHELYGEMCGQLNLCTRAEVDTFLQRVRETGTRLLSELTGGVHLHTVSCRDAEHFARIRQALTEQGMLYQG